MARSPCQTKRFRSTFHLALLRSAALGVASCTMLCAQTLLNTRTLSGSASDSPTTIATDSQGNVYLAGTTNSPDFPLTHPLYSQLLEPGLRLSTDGRTFVPTTLSATEVDVVAASSDGSLVLAGTPGGLYRSTDGGATWTPSQSLTSQILALAIDPTNRSVAYAVALTTGVQTYTWHLQKSTDGGLNWQETAAYTLSPFTDAVSRIFINPVTPSTVYAFVNAALMRSLDSGISWQTVTIPAAQANLGQTNPTAFAIAPSQPNIAYATTFYLPMMKSLDGGVTWQPAAAMTSGGEYAIAIDPQNASNVWMVNGVGINKSTDGAATFQRIANMGDGSWQSIIVSSRNSSQVYAADGHNVYATFDGGATWNIVASGQIKGIFDTAAGIYVAAATSGTIFLTKLDSTLNQVIYSTFLGPGTPTRIVVDAAGNVYLAGTTTSHSFPTTASVLGRDFTSATAGFVTKVRADGGALLYSTLLDGLPPTGLAVDAAGDAVIVGSTTGTVPVTQNALQSTAPATCTRRDSTGAQVLTTYHAFVAKLKPDASGYVYATWLTGACGDYAYDVVTDSTGAAWVGGTTYSTDFPTTGNGLTAAFPAISYAGFVAELSPDGSHLAYSTFLPATFDSAVYRLALDGAGNVIAAGTGDAKATSGAYQRPAGSCPPVFGLGGFGGSAGTDDAFVLKLSPGAATPTFLATVGGSCNDGASQLAIDSAGDIWIAGSTQSSDFPTFTPLAGLGIQAGQSAYLAELDPSGSKLLSASTSAAVGSVATGPSGVVYFTEAIAVAGKSGTAVLATRIDPSQHPAIALDAIHTFQTSTSLSPAYLPPTVAPGEAVRLIGRGMGTSAKVTFNGIAAPVVSTQPTEIVCFVPFALDGTTSANVQVTSGGAVSNLYSITVAQQNPDIVAVANADGSLNSEANPAAVNSVVVVYLTGLGQTTPPSTDGAVNLSPLVAPRTMPSITVNGQKEQPVFLGAAVGQTAGVMQLNLFVPDPGASSNDAVYIGAQFFRIWTRSGN